jgi:hypothetical protein|tara:strand:+ start:231 stop:416 length:186 start_codon:yes stop_codon:yes gene_type:complete
MSEWPERVFDEERNRILDDPYWFVDRHVTIRQDGTPVLVFGVEQMETELRALLNAVRRGER